MNLVVYGKDFDTDYERAHILIGRLPGSSYSFQPRQKGFILVFENGTKEEMEKLIRNGLTASLKARRDLDFSPIAN